MQTRLLGKGGGPLFHLELGSMRARACRCNRRPPTNLPTPCSLAQRLEPRGVCRAARLHSGRRCGGAGARRAPGSVAAAAAAPPSSAAALAAGCLGLRARDRRREALRTAATPGGGVAPGAAAAARPRLGGDCPHCGRAAGAGPVCTATGHRAHGRGQRRLEPAHAAPAGGLGLRARAAAGRGHRWVARLRGRCIKWCRCMQATQRADCGCPPRPAGQLPNAIALLEAAQAALHYGEPAVGALLAAAQELLSLLKLGEELREACPPVDAAGHAMPAPLHSANPSHEVLAPPMQLRSCVPRRWQHLAHGLAGACSAGPAPAPDAPAGPAGQR